MAWHMLARKACMSCPSIDPDVGKPEFLEEHPRDEERLDRFLDVLSKTIGLCSDRRDARHTTFEVLAEAREGWVETDAIEVELQGSHVRADRHLVVVEDDDERSAEVADLVHRFKGHAPREGAVADHADDRGVGLAGEPRGLDESETVADRRRGVARTDDVVGRLIATGESGQAVLLADRTELIAPPGEKLVRVALMPDVPDDLVLGAAEDTVKGDRELDGAETGGKVTAHLAHARQDRLADLVGQEVQLWFRELAKVGWVGDPGEVSHRRSSIAPGSTATPPVDRAAVPQRRR